MPAKPPFDRRLTVAHGQHPLMHVKPSLQRLAAHAADPPQTESPPSHQDGRVGAADCLGASCSKESKAHHATARPYRPGQINDIGVHPGKLVAR